MKSEKELPRPLFARFIAPLFVTTAVLAYGLWQFHHLLWSSGFTKIHGDLGDARLVALFLEHHFQLFIGNASGLTQVPWAFFPASGQYFYTDNLLGGAITYVPLRLFLDEPFRAYGAWMVLSSALNFLVMLWLLWPILRCHWLAASAGSYLFAFCLPRNVWLMHAQLLPQYPSVLALGFLILAWRRTGGWARGLAAAAAAVCIAWQFWIGFYLGWFFGLGMLSAGTYLMWGRARRLSTVAFLRANAVAFLPSALLLFFLLWPYANGYLEVMASLGSRSWSEIRGYLPRPAFYLYAPGGSLLYGSALDFVYRFISPGQAPEGFMFLGFLPLALVVVAVLFARTKKLELLQSQNVLVGLCLAVLGVVCVSSLASRTGYSLWWLVYKLVPGAKGIRAVGRISLFMAIPVSILVAVVLNHLPSLLKGHVSRLLVLGLVLGIMAEQSMEQRYGFPVALHQSRVARITAALNSKGTCDSFFLKSTNGMPAYVQQDAMWASLVSGVPTINGYMGNEPPGWGMFDLSKVAETQVWTWLGQHGLTAENHRLCFLEMNLPDELMATELGEKN